MNDQIRRCTSIIITVHIPQCCVKKKAKIFLKLKSQVSYNMLVWIFDEISGFQDFYNFKLYKKNLIDFIKDWVHAKIPVFNYFLWSFPDYFYKQCEFLPFTSQRTNKIEFSTNYPQVENQSILLSQKIMIYTQKTHHSKYNG